MNTIKDDNRVIKILIWIAIVSIVSALIVPPVAVGVSPVPIVIGLLALAIAIAIPLLLVRKRPIFMAVWLAVYIIVYGLLSWRGAYIEGNFGGSDNRSVWYPAYCGEVYQGLRQHCSLRPLAWFFLPPILVDRAFIHQTRFNVF
jgi:hypothetical protein